MNALNHESVWILWSTRAKGKRYSYAFYRTILIDERYEVAARSEEEARMRLEHDRYLHWRATEPPDDPMPLVDYLDHYPDRLTPPHEEFELEDDLTEEADDED